MNNDILIKSIFYCYSPVPSSSSLALTTPYDTKAMPTRTIINFEFILFDFLEFRKKGCSLLNKLQETLSLSYGHL